MWLTRNALCRLGSLYEWRNAPQLWPYISASSDILAYNGWLMHGGILWLSVGEISTIIGQRKTALAHTPWRQVLLAISTNHLILGHYLEFGARWPILMHAGERDDLTDSKYVPLQRRTFEQFDAQVFHRASLSGRFVLQQVHDNKPAKSWKCSGS